MMSSGTSTDAARPGSASGMQPWHFYFIASMAGATWAVLSSRRTDPAALAMLSAAILAAGVAGAALHYALLGFFGVTPPQLAALPDHVRADLERDKALVLRAIKDLEFDRAMGKVNDKDFADLDSRLRARALALMAQLDAAAPSEPIEQVPVGVVSVAGQCASCGTANDADARFCKQCGAKIA